MKIIAALVITGLASISPVAGQQPRSAIPVEIVASPSVEPDAAERARSDADLLAQQQMAQMAQWMFWATAFSLVVSTGALFGLLFSLRQTRQAIRESREVGEVEAQAYVHAVSAQFGSGTVLVACQNTGSSPATHFSVAGTVRLVERGKVTESIGFTNGPFKTFSALGGGETLTVSIGPSQDVQSFRFEQSGDQLLLICGQIIYCTVFNHDHETQFAFYVDPSDRTKFRRPVSNIRSFWRIPKAGLPAPTLVDPTASEPEAAEAPSND